jgi:glutathione S-transferase
MHLFGSTDSGHSYKARTFLLLSQTPHTYQWVDLSKPRLARDAAFVAASKFGEVPVLVDQGQPLCQSNSILIHLAQSLKQFCGSQGEWPSIVEWLFWESNRIGFSVPNLRYALLWGAQPPEVIDYLRHRVMVDLGTLDEVLSKTAFLLPSGPTIADLSCSAYLFWLHQIDITDREFSNVERWLSALRALPGWAHPDEAMKIQWAASP